MMTKQFFLSLFICYFITNGVAAQPVVPTEYFSNPLNIDLKLSGTFGELRSNHFHSGMDIKTLQKEGYDVLASAEGYISRIKISHYGYGKALYITHPNGYSTVYAHLQRFSPKIEAYIKKRQYEKQSYEIEVFPTSTELNVQQGELIAFSGNSGSSGGPHLHFEIRDGNSRPMNPMLFNIDIKDTTAPIINSLWVYPQDDNSHVNGDANKQKLRLIPQQDGSYTAEKIKACGNLGFGISTVDRQDYAPNKNGIYKIDTQINGNPNFSIQMDRFSFSETRYLNRMIDYEYFKDYKSRVQMLFVQENNPLSVYKNLENNGYLSITDEHSFTYTIIVSDFSGNKRIVRIPIEGETYASIKPKDIKTTPYFVDADEATAFEEKGIDVYIPSNALYEDTYLNIKFVGDSIHFHEDNTPIHKNITIGFDVEKYSPEDRKKLYIARLYGYYKNPSYVSTYKKGARFTTKTRTFGIYTLVEDTIAPEIKALNFSNKKWISNNTTLRLKIEDKGSGIKNYHATVNGKYILTEYNYKKGTLTHSFEDGVVTETENKLQVIVTDNVGNSTTFESTFFRKN